MNLNIPKMYKILVFLHRKDRILSPFTKQNQDNLSLLNFACLFMQEGTLSSFSHTQPSVQYCVEENSSAEVKKIKWVHVNIRSFIWGKKDMHKRPTCLQLPHTTLTTLPLPVWVQKGEWHTGKHMGFASAAPGL